MKVLFLAGTGRCGSTVLERALARTPGFTPLGEMVYLWSRGLRENTLCECGQPFRSCTFWTAVLQEACGGADAVPLPDIEPMTQWTLSRPRGVPRRVFQMSTLPLFSLPTRYRRQAAAYAAVLARVYGAAARVSGASVLIDSSKDPAHAFLLGRVPGLELSVVHLVRDSRAVAFSWQRRKRRPEVTDSIAYMSQHPPAQSARTSMLLELLVPIMARRGRASLTVRYEDFVRDPEGTVARIRAYAGLPPAAASARGDTHSMAGNPILFEEKDAPLRLDDEWKAAMKPRDRALVTLLSWPMLLRHGYLR